MLKLLLPYARANGKQFMQGRRLFQTSKKCALFSVPKLNLSNAPQSSYLGPPRRKLIAWGISGAVILTSMIVVDKWCALLFAVPLLLLNGRDVYVITKMLPRDLRFIKRYIHHKYITKKIVLDNWTIPKLFRNTAIANKNDVMLVMNGQEWKYKEIYSYANRVSRLFQKHKLGKGDVVCLMLNNSPEMIAILIGLAQIGVISSLINYNLVSHGLMHCIDVSNCSFLIVDTEHVEAVENIRSSLRKDLKMYQFKDRPVANGYLMFEEELYKENDEAPEVIVKPSHDDSMLYIYTSGTGGTPKAAIIPHSKFIGMNLSSAILVGLTRKDKIYNPLPLYHTTGLVVGTGPCITGGIPVVIRKKFSSHFYFTDCQQQKCSLGMYVGDICRYIYSVPPADSDNKHGLKFMLGNGLNPELWESFQSRFNVRMIELYGSTEGNCNMINIDGRTGAVGFLPKIIPFFFYPFYIIRIDQDSMEPVRDPDSGLCIKCKYDEPGMLVGRIKKSSESKFHGYVNREEETQARVINNVFTIGDSAFMTGDLLMMDEFHYFYFKDRTGDTFRWKGENVSTVEIENIIAGLTHKTCACYGVKLKGYDGYAGMISLEDPDETINLNELLRDLIHHLPKYSVPRFVRIVKKVEMTSTHKIMKRDLAKDGINLDVIKDKVYFLHSKNKAYELLTKDAIKRIENYEIPL